MYGWGEEIVVCKTSCAHSICKYIEADLIEAFNKLFFRKPVRKRTENRMCNEIRMCEVFSLSCCLFLPPSCFCARRSRDVIKNKHNATNRVDKSLICSNPDTIRKHVFYHVGFAGTEHSLLFVRSTQPSSLRVPSLIRAAYSLRAKRANESSLLFVIDRFSAPSTHSSVVGFCCNSPKVASENVFNVNNQAEFEFFFHVFQRTVNNLRRGRRTKGKTETRQPSRKLSSI